MALLFNYAPHPGQQRIHQSRNFRFRSICCGRRWGKTLCLAAELLDRGGGEKAGDYGWIAPTYTIADRGIDALKQIAPHFITFRGRNPVVAHFTGSQGPCRIFFLSADNIDSNVGFGFEGIVVDEAARIPVDTWNYTFRPTIGQTYGWAVFISTPKGRNWFFDQFTRGLEAQEGYASFTFPSNSSPYFPREEWEEAKRDFPIDVFRQEYEAEFLEDSAGVFRGVDDCVIPAECFAHSSIQGDALPHPPRVASPPPTTAQAQSAQGEKAGDHVAIFDDPFANPPQPEFNFDLPAAATPLIYATEPTPAEPTKDPVTTLRIYDDEIKTVTTLRTNPTSGHIVIGLDVAKHMDFTVLVAMDAETGICFDIDRFNQIDWTVQKERILSFARKHRGSILMDATGVGDPIFDDLLNHYGDIEPLKFTPQSKTQLIQRLIVAVEQREIKWPGSRQSTNIADRPLEIDTGDHVANFSAFLQNWDILTSEMKRYEYKIGPTGLISYNAPDGYHDDCVIALALANQKRHKSGSAGTMARFVDNGARIDRFTSRVSHRRRDRMIVA
jgi:hypothetical protein